MYFSENGFVFETTNRSGNNEVVKNSVKRDLNWDSKVIRQDGFDIIPLGSDNKLAQEIRDTISGHNLAPRIFTKRKFLTWGQGPILYKTKLVGGSNDNEGTSLQRLIVQDNEVQDWLESFDHESYLLKVIEDYNYMEAQATKFFRNKGPRISGLAKIAKLEHVDIDDVRYAGKDLRNNKPTHFAVGDFHSSQRSKFNFYPIFDNGNPGKSPVSIQYSNMKSAGQKHYSVPDVIGSLAWIRRANDVPFILEALTKNSIHVKWHIIVPQSYWNAKEDVLKRECSLNGVAYENNLLEKFKDSIFEKLASVLAGVDNVGKFWASESITHILGNNVHVDQWEIKPLDQKIKDFVEAQIKISERTDFTTTSGLGLHQALSNITSSGKSDSGSEQLYAYKNHQLSEVVLPELLICKSINDAIKINWPNKKLKVGFHRSLPEKEEDVTKSKRTSNAVE